ncbi:alcohol dehydrogenase catalytic domain-containing protein [bacterium]|nr:alcohol dehydrogenase catalytic domain-containing protein [bacterium]RQV95258.1 MAG: hypothetical protein EH221_06345 [bacterium]
MNPNANKMKAAVLKGGSQVRNLRDFVLGKISMPRVQKGDVLVQVYACGFCQTDYKAITGKRALPILDDHIVGHEPSGVIVDVGEKVKDFHVGDRVAISPLAYCGECSQCRRGSAFTHYCQNAIVYGGDGPPKVQNGAFAQYIAVDQKSVYPIPDGISFEDAALLEPTAGAWKGLHNSEMGKGEDVVVIGAGGIGMLVALLAKKLGGGRVVVIDISQYVLSKASEWGIDHVVQPSEVTGKAAYTARDYQIITDHVCRLLGKQPDLVIESAGPPEAVGLMWNMVLSGRGIKGNVFGITTHEEIPVDCGKLHFAEPKITSSFNVSRYSLEQAMKVIEKGFRPSQIVTHRYRLDQIHDAVEMVSQPDRLKVMVYPNPDLYSGM